MGKRERKSSAGVSSVSSKKTKSAAAAEIEALFASKPKKTPASSSAGVTKTEPKEHRRKPKERDGFEDTRGMGKVRALTDDGLPIYTAEEMGMLGGGDTAECPFDCSCCF